MVKKMISRFSVLAVLIVFMAACSEKLEYTNVIPADASAIASINLKSLADKSGLKDKENEAAKQKMIEALKSGTTAATFQQLEKVLNNPKESGIDVDAPVYAFTATSFPYATLVAKVLDADKLHTSLDIMVKEQICQPIEETDGYSYTTIDKNIFAFNATTVMLVQTNSKSQMEKAQKAIGELMKQAPDKSIANNAGFLKMQKQKGDINFLASLAALPQAYASQISMGLSGIKITPKDIMVLGNLSFEKGKIALQFEYYTENEEAKAMLAKQEKATTKLSTTFLKYFPASTIAFMNIGVNGEELYNLLQENEEFRNTVSISKAEEVKALFASFNGDISAGLINVTMGKDPAFMVYADAKNGNALKALYDNKKALNLKRGEDIVQLSENEYVYKSRAMNLFFGFKDNQMYATNDELLYKNIGKAVDKSIKDTGYVSDMKGKNFFFVISMDAILELPIVKMMVGFGGEEYQTYYNLASQVSYLEISNVNDGVSEMDLVLKNKDINSLKLIVDFVKKFAGM
ncbi:DUF4836 family protein [Bacteroides sp.]